MNYNEFISISKESMNEITYEVYSKEIEPCYNWLPEVNSKKEFIKWWKANKDMCRWISNILTQLEEEGSEKLRLKKKVNELESKLNIMKEEKEAIMQEKEICISEREQIEQEYYNTKKVREQLDEENEKLYVALEKKKEQMDDLMSEALNDRSNLLDKIADLELRIAFTPEAITKVIRNEFFETYDEKKQDAIKRGIINESDVKKG